MHALTWLHREDIVTLGLPQFITDLKLQIVKTKLDEIEGELEEKVTCRYVLKPDLGSKRLTRAE